MQTSGRKIDEEISGTPIGSRNRSIITVNWPGDFSPSGTSYLPAFHKFAKVRLDAIHR
jgi:hypothetical protein